MPTSTENLAAIEEIMTAELAERAANCDETQKQIEEAYLAIKKKIPAAIADALLRNRSFATITEVVEDGISNCSGWEGYKNPEAYPLFTYPSWWAQARSHPVKHEWLNSLARRVWDYCVKEGFSPTMAKTFPRDYSPYARFQVTSIQITFNKDHLRARLAKINPDLALPTTEQ